ncbi:RsmE family RNA methyltransferase [Candidatus Haliotispira prima]|uniref:Ribosomal RNA small subunit methyltransferase E n=1 Tax=Candidatus Haliotispira prima TaxID=3034016 RepID=A0ABY8MGA1_9SPIO|nr:RsmE family RNA methyltransferase [Candidatus Haliotispira prima]
MNRILLNRKELDSQSCCILPADDYRARHLKEVLKVKLGQQLEAGLLHTSCSGCFEILELGADGSVFARFLGQEDEEEKNRWQNLSLGLGLPRPPVLKRLLRDLASAGLREITLIQADLCEGDYRKSHIWDDLERFLILGAEQGRLNRLPQLNYEERNGLPLRDYLAESKIFREREKVLSQNCLVLDQGGATREYQRSGSSEPYIMAVGPERGWTSKELQAFEDQSFQNCSLGPLTLRTEVVGHLALGLYLLETQAV